VSGLTTAAAGRACAGACSARPRSSREVVQCAVDFGECGGGTPELVLGAGAVAVVPSPVPVPVRVEDGLEVCLRNCSFHVELSGERFRVGLDNLEEMGVDVERGRGVGVAEPAADRPHRYAVGERLRRVEMTEVVQAHAREADSVADAPKVARHCVRVEGMRAMVKMNPSGLISRRRIFGGEALAAGLVGIQPHRTAWPSAPRNTAWTCRTEPGTGRARGRGRRSRRGGVEW